MTQRSIGEQGENRIVSRFRALAGGTLGPGVVVGPGDDAAALDGGGDRLLLLACDMMVEGVHFRREWAQPQQIGWKAMAQNLSDIAAMGGEPAAAVASLAAPGDLGEEVAIGIAEGLAAAASRYGAALVGGDLVGSPGPVVVDVAITGWVARNHLLLRQGAQAGDALLVTGRLGAAAAGLAALERGLAGSSGRVPNLAPMLVEALRAHHEPEPRLREAGALAATGCVTSMMDLSDGLADDLPRLCAESGVGARLWSEAVPVAPSCAFVANELGLSSLQMALSGGEDYELLLTCPPAAVDAVTAAVAEATGTAVTVVGEVVAEQRVFLVDAGGGQRPLGRGFDHFGRASGSRGGDSGGLEESA